MEIGIIYLIKISFCLFENQLVIVHLHGKVEELERYVILGYVLSRDVYILVFIIIHMINRQIRSVSKESTESGE